MMMMGCVAMVMRNSSAGLLAEPDIERNRQKLQMMCR